jgi:hypothetical protein
MYLFIIALSIIIPPIVAALLSGVLGHLIFKDTNWQQAFFMMPFFYLGYQILCLVIATPLVLLLRKIGVSVWISCPLIGLILPAIALNRAFPFAEHWYSYWPYWIAGCLSGFVGAYLVTRIAVYRKS